MNYHGLVNGVLLCLLTAWCRIGMSDEEIRCPAYKYRGENLDLVVHALRKQSTVFDVTPIDDSARPMKGDERSLVLALEEGTNAVSVPVGDVGVHRLAFHLDGARCVVLANRGTWFSLPKRLFVTQIQPVPLSCGEFDGHSELLAQGYGVEMVQSPTPPSHLVLGRTFGYGSSAGIPVTRGLNALYIVAEGNVEAVSITLGQRVSNDEMQYFDYDLALDSLPRRYVIPLDTFQARGDKRSSLGSIQSISIRTIRRAKKGDRIVVHKIGLTIQGARISGIERKPRVIAHVTPDTPPRRSWMFYRTGAGVVSKKTVREGRVSISKNAKSVWLCAEEGVCDPPDAPHSAYAVPPFGREPYVIDTFDTLAQVNAQRRPISVFGSSEEVDRRLEFDRVNNTLRIGFRTISSGEYIGYLTPLPREIPSRYKTISVVLRCRIPFDSVLIGLRDDRGREGRVPLSAYLDRPRRRAEGARGGNGGLGEANDFRTVSVPMEVFRGIVRSGYSDSPNLEKPTAVFVTVMGDDDAGWRGIELDRIQMETGRVPMTIARFERRHRRNITDLGSVIHLESDHGGEIEAKYDAAGYRGNGMRITVRSTRPEGYALAALGTSSVDVRGYRSLRFRVRGRDGGEKAAIYLNDGANRRMVCLEEYVRVGKNWRSVEIPLSKFKRKGIDLRHVFQVIVAFENRTIEEEVLWFDDLVFQ